MSSTEDRLRAEANFQNERVRIGHDTEARNRFYYLAERARERYQAELSDIDGKRILIVGCSEGGVTPMARRGAAQVVGIDIADEAIRRLNEGIEEEGLAARARALVMDAENLSFENERFDIIACSGVLHHLDVERAASSWSKHLAPDGKIVMLEPMAWNPAALVYRRFTPSMRTEFEHPLKPVDIERHFEEVKVESFVLASLLSLPSAYVSRLEPFKDRAMRVLESVDDVLFSVFPPLRYLGWTAVIICRRPRKAS